VRGGWRAQRAGWGAARESGKNCRYDTLEFTVDLVVPKTQNSIASGFEYPITLDVGREILVESVLAAIDFDDQLLPAALEINDVGRDGRLAPKMKPKVAQLAELYPKLHLLRRHSLA
jgi:hypothetical protein